MCQVRDQLEHKLQEASRQFVLADADARRAPSHKNSSQLLVSKADEMKHGAELALQRHLTQCPYCQAN